MTEHISPSAELDRVLQNLRAMLEVDMHVQIIIPLLRARGATHVNHVHGSFERGKDIVYVYNDFHGTSCLEVCQVKNEALSGRAGATSSAFVTLQQLQQAIQVEVLNPATSQKELPSGAVLYTTYPIPDGATADGKAFLDHLRASRCKVIPPETFVAQIRQCLTSTYDALAFPGKTISSAMQRYVGSHREAQAFELSRVGKLDDFFVNLGVSPSGSVLDRLLSGTVAPLPLANIDITREDCEDLVALQDAFAPEIKCRLFDVVKARFKNKKTKIGDMSSNAAGSTEAPMSVRVLTSEHTRIRKLNFPKYWKALVKYFEHARDRSRQCRNEYEQIALVVKTMETVSGCGNMFEYMSGVIGAPVFATRPDSDHIAPSAFAFPAVSPAALLEMHEHICLVGEPGAGKTCVARRLAEIAIERNLKCLYFPCSNLQAAEDTLGDSIASFVRSLVPDAEIGDAVQLLRTTDLLILDGCDEAATFPDKLATEIRHLTQRISQTCKTSRQAVPRIPGDLLDAIQYTASTHSIELKETITPTDFGRLVRMNRRTCFEKPLQHIAEQTLQMRPRVVVTTRDASELNLPRGFLEIKLMPFNDSQIHEFFDRWFSGTDRDAQPVLDFLSQNAHVTSICRNPMTATIVAALHENGYSLPQSRVEVYQKRLDLVVERWDRVRSVPNRNRILPRDKTNYLARLALRLHRERRRTFSARFARQVWDDGFSRHYASVSISDLLWELQHCNNLIEKEGTDLFTLGHLSYQEFFAALGVVHCQAIKVFHDCILDPWWRQVAIFYAGLTGDLGKILAYIHTKYPLEEWGSLVEEMEAEARYTPEVVRTAIQQIRERYSDDDDDIVE